MSAISESIPDSVQAVLCFTADGHYLLCHADAGTGWVRQKFLSPGDVQAALALRDPDSGWFTNGLVRTGAGAQGDWLVFTRTARRARMNIQTSEGNQTLTVPFPHLVFLVYGAKSYVWAIRRRAFSPRAEAYTAPFPNVYRDGSICWGGNPPPAADPARIEAIWQAFLEAPFNQDLTSDRSRSYRRDVRGLWLRLDALYRERRCGFPSDELLPVGGSPVSIGYVINRTLFPHQSHAWSDGSTETEEGDE
jgi:hypothetical protein